ncbi:MULTISPECIES: RNA polymerase sporulation sigma factor SigF [Pelosinus]|uniref:RNA polymerase sigma factor n=1 Tax=Pelosinus fermentans B4 TaxID=1149862 RepID=I8RJQ4_9FIRM|nr:MULTISPECIES: RNA polymerase sporulation sigma factor SigF [Pelosinus]EIW18460.1 RNA polymerase sigma-F factor [Pelosinus fermentans B4]EIW24474.1 RNA polymerase, sigma 28 subunit, SigF [Pelosinus fermentans A11]OAM94468.1 RNA polymerase, sigma 28 subunit, SigF [Pelosinus fermentans DSM 17108]SDR09901.1 RNA polymerase, sigma subunit, RpoX/SigF [Pelosinus fermentans]
MLEDEEIKKLLHKAQAGDQIAKEYILENNINLVRSVVHRFTNRGYEWDDLFQLGCIGLVKAIERFDTKFSVKFSTYAVPMIIGEIRRFIRDDNPVKVSRPVKELAYKVHRTQERLQGILGRDPTITEIAKELSLAPQEVVAALEAIQTPTSLYANVFHDDGDPILLLDQMKYCEEEDSAYFEKLALKEIVLRLPEKERLVIHLRFFADKTQAEVAQIIGLSQVQISRIEKQALKLMKEFMQTS